jgi:hypothetical protein
MNWKFFDLQRIIDEMFVNDRLHPSRPDAVTTEASQ